MKRIIVGIITAVLLLAVVVACSDGERPLTVDELLALGEQFLLDRNYEQALVQFMQAIEVEPMNPRGYTGAAEAYVGLGEYDRAREVLEDGLSVVGGDVGISSMLDDIQSAAEGRWLADNELAEESSLAESDIQGLESGNTSGENDYSNIITVSYSVAPMFDFQFVHSFTYGVAGVGYFDGNYQVFGYINAQGEIVIPIEHRFSTEVVGFEVPTFSERRVVIPSTELSSIAIFDTDGNQVLPFGRYRGARSFSEGFSTVLSEEGSAVIDIYGNIVIPFGRYDFIGSFYEGLARVAIRNRATGFIDSYGNESIPLQFNAAGDFSEGLAAFTNRDPVDGPWGFIDKSGNVIIQPQFFSVYQGWRHTNPPQFFDGRAIVAQSELGPEQGVIDTSGNIVVPFGRYHYNTWVADYTRGFSGGLAVVMRDGSPGVIDIHGNELIPLGRFSSIRGFSNGLAAVNAGTWENPRWGFIDHLGNIVIEPQFSEAFGFSNGLAAVRTTDDLWGFINYEGSMVVEPQYSHVHSFREGFAWVNAGTGDNPLWGILQIDNLN